VQIALRNTGVSLGVVRALSAGVNTPAVLGVDLSDNHYHALPANAFNTSSVTSLSLRGNGLTSIPKGIFLYNFYLRSLDLSNNSLTSLALDTVDALPALQTLTLLYNEITAIPSTSNHIAIETGTFHNPLLGNPLRCAQYGPVATGCVCPGDHTLSYFCGYVRCTPSSLRDGCPVGTIFNSTDCFKSPGSSCVSDTGTPTDQFYDASLGAFLPLTPSCVSLYRGASGTPIRGFEYARPTLSSDRQCSICSGCPDGFSAVGCTATSNTQCTKALRLGPSAIAAIVLTLLLPIIGGVLVLLYMRVRSTRRKLGQTKNYLELTENLLGTEREHKEQMEQAWKIQEADLSFGKVIGEGAFGRVFGGMWGHIPVAVKVLRVPMDDLDTHVLMDYQREVRFMSSIRHPHILT
jgi:hypothetical protein